MCRVFQKSSSPKKPQQTPSSPQSQDSPCDTNNAMMLNELGDIELPNFNNNNNNINMNYNPSSSSAHDQDSNNMMMMMNWSAAANSLPSLTNWPLLTTNLSMNSLLLTALQLRGAHHPTTATASTTTTTTADNNIYSNFIMRHPQGNIIDNSQFGNDFNSNFDMASTSRVVDPVAVAGQPPISDQPYNVDSDIW